MIWLKLGWSAHLVRAALELQCGVEIVKLFKWDRILTMLLVKWRSVGISYNISGCRASVINNNTTAENYSTQILNK